MFRPEANKTNNFPDSNFPHKQNFRTKQSKGFSQQAKKAHNCRPWQFWNCLKDILVIWKYSDSFESVQKVWNNFEMSRQFWKELEYFEVIQKYLDSFETVWKGLYHLKKFRQLWNRLDNLRHSEIFGQFWNWPESVKSSENVSTVLKTTRWFWSHPERSSQF